MPIGPRRLLATGARSCSRLLPSLMGTPRPVLGQQDDRCLLAVAFGDCNQHLVRVRRARRERKTAWFSGTPARMPRSRKRSLTTPAAPRRRSANSLNVGLLTRQAATAQAGELTTLRIPLSPDSAVPSSEKPLRPGSDR